MALSEISLNEKEDRRERTKRCPLLHLFFRGEREKKLFTPPWLSVCVGTILLPLTHSPESKREEERGKRYCRSSGGAAAAEEEEGGKEGGE